MNWLFIRKRAIKHSFNWFSKGKHGWKLFTCKFALQLQPMNNWIGTKSEISALASPYFLKTKTCDHNADSECSTGTDHESICVVANALHTATESFMFTNQKNKRTKKIDGFERITHKDVHFNEIKSTRMAYAPWQMEVTVLLTEWWGGGLWLHAYNMRLPA